MSFNLLVVDDSRTVRAVLTKTLKIAKIPTNQVFEAENGKDALDIVADEWIDLIFADINMPVMNGVEMIEKLKGDPCSESIPVVVVFTCRIPVSGSPQVTGKATSTVSPSVTWTSRGFEVTEQFSARPVSSTLYVVGGSGE